MAPFKIVFSRHGQSQGNKDNRFCGWYDAPLTEEGRQEAIQAGEILKKGCYQFDIAYTSFLTRAQDTLQLILTETGQTNIPIYPTWQLNEKHFGVLTGQLKEEALKKYGEERLTEWRKSMSTAPPPMKENHPYYKDIVRDPKYRNQLQEEYFPNTESFRMAKERALLFWAEKIVPEIKSNKNILIVTHENILKGFIEHLEPMVFSQIQNLSLPTAVPFVYTLDDDLRPISTVEFLRNDIEDRFVDLQLKKKLKRKE